MSRQERLHTKVYRARRDGWRWAAAAMTAISLLLVAAGVWGSRQQSDGLAVEPSLTPAPTAITRVFDETADSRQIAVPSTAWYAIQLGVFESEESACQQADAYRSRGAAGYIWPDGQRYRVLAAVYPEEADAKSVRTQLKEGQGIDSYVYVIQPAELTLKLNGMAGQLDVLEAIYTYWHQAALELQRWSVEMDQRETDVEGLRQRIANLLDSNHQLLELVAQRFTQPYHAAVAPAVELMQEFNTRLQNWQLETNAVALGAGLKYETLWLMAGVQDYYKQLIH